MKTFLVLFWSRKMNSLIFVVIVMDITYPFTNRHCDHRMWVWRKCNKYLPSSAGMEWNWKWNEIFEGDWFLFVCRAQFVGSSTVKKVDFPLSVHYFIIWWTSNSVIIVTQIAVIYLTHQCASRDADSLFENQKLSWDLSCLGKSNLHKNEQ